MVDLAWGVFTFELHPPPGLEEGGVYLGKHAVTWKQDLGSCLLCAHGATPHPSLLSPLFDDSCPHTWFQTCFHGCHHASGIKGISQVKVYPPALGILGVQTAPALRSDVCHEGCT